MAARLWCWLLGCEVALAAGLGAMLWILFPVSAQAAGAIALALALCAPAILVATSFGIGVFSVRRTLTLPDVGYLLGALLAEIIDFNVAVLVMIVTLRAGSRVASINTQVRDRPVLLIHGFICNRSVWEPWLQRLQAAGFGPIRLLDLEPPLADIEIHALRVERELRSLQQQTAGKRVDIIAHSMGGLVARAALRRVGSGVVGRIITIGTPHHGTCLARLFRWAPLRQMCPESTWLRTLNEGQETCPDDCFTSIYSREDNLVVPTRSAILEHARLIEVRGIGHLGLLSSRKVMRCALAALASG